MSDTGNACLIRPVSARLAAAYAVWCEASGARIAPRRDEITPAKLRNATASTFIIDVIDGGKDFRFRFAGDRIIQFMGRRLAGMLLSELRGTPFFEGMHGMYTRCAALRVPVSGGPMASTYPGKEFLEIEALVMPLSEDGHAVSALFGAFDSWPQGKFKA